MDNSIEKRESNPAKSNRNSAPERTLLNTEIDRLAEELVTVEEQIEQISTETSTLEDIEGCKLLAAAVLEKYSTLKEHLSENHRFLLDQSVGPAIERIKKGLTLLKEAPE